LPWLVYVIIIIIIIIAVTYKAHDLSPVHTRNNVEATFAFVERIVRLVAFDVVAGVWTGLYRGSTAPHKNTKTSTVIR